VDGRRVAEHVDDLEGAGLLALDAVGVDRVDELDRVRLRAATRQSSKFPSTWSSLAPCAMAWLSLPMAILPSGTSTAQVMPAAVA
jgi:hypothetical protein